jgi:hypothetical protein
MRKHLKILTVATGIVALLLANGPTGAIAYDYGSHPDPPPLYLTENTLTLKQGETSHNIGLHSDDYVTCFIEGANSSDTYINLVECAGGYYTNVHVGADESSRQFHVYYYKLNTSDDIHDDLLVIVDKNYALPNKAASLQNANNKSTQDVKSASAENVPVNSPPAASISYPAGGTGVFSLINNGKNAMFYDSAGKPMAQFSVYGPDGCQVVMTNPSFSNGYANVTVSVSQTLKASDSDIAVMKAHGIKGVRINDLTIDW